MAYETGSALDMDDLLDKLDTFLVANGYTQDHFDLGAGKVAWHRNSLYVSGRFVVATPQALSLHQALGFVGTGTDPGSHTNDSGNGYNGGTYNNANLASERHVLLNDGPFPSYYFFEDDFYTHVVVETSTDVFRHFGFGELDKRGTWVGGEYCYGQRQVNSSPISGTNCTLLDGLFSETAGAEEFQAATLHCEGLAGQAAAGRWAQVWGNTSGEPNDTAGNAKVRVRGGFKSGPIARHFGVFNADVATGLIPQYPIGLFHRNSTDTQLLGFMPDVRGLNMKFFAPKQEVTISSDTWIIFPMSQKTTAAVTDRSYNSGISYKKVTT